MWPESKWKYGPAFSHAYASHLCIYLPFLDYLPWSSDQTCETILLRCLIARLISLFPSHSKFSREIETITPIFYILRAFWFAIPTFVDDVEVR